MKRVSVFSVLKNRDVRRVFSAEVVSDIGNFITFIALAVRVHDLSGGTVAVGIALALRSIPWFTLGPFTGVLVDRMDRRLVMVGADLARAVLVTVLAFTSTVGQMYIIAFISGCFGPFFRPARQALLPSIAPGDQYVKAIAVSEIAHQSLHMTGPAIGGLVVLAVGAKHAFLVDAVTFLISAALVIGIRVRGAQQPRPEGFAELRADFKAGARMLWREKVLRSLVGFRGAIFLADAGVAALLVFYIKDSLGRGAGSYGFALAIAGAGTALFSLVLARRGSAIRRYPALMVSALSPMMFCLVIFRPSFVLLLGIMAIEGIMITGLALYDDVIIAERTPEEMRGRVFSLSGATAEVFEFGGSLGFAALGGAIGVARAIAVAGAVATVLGLFALAPARWALIAADREAASS